MRAVWIAFVVALCLKCWIRPGKHTVYPQYAAAPMVLPLGVAGYLVWLIGYVSSPPQPLTTGGPLSELRLSEK